MPTVGADPRIVIGYPVAANLKLTCDELGPDKDITQVVQPLEARAGVEVRALKG